MQTGDFLPLVTRPYVAWSDKKLAIESKAIQLALTDNVFFPVIDPGVGTYAEAVDDYIQQLAKASLKDVNAVALKNTSRMQLIKLTVSVGNSVSQLANGNLDALLSTLLPLRRKPQATVLQKPAGLKITNGRNPGELHLKVDGMKVAHSFNFTYTQDPPTADSVWTTITSSKSKLTVSGLEAGKKYWFKVAAIGSKQQLVWGDTMQSPFVQ